MKKSVFCMLLALCLCLSFSTVAYANGAIGSIDADDTVTDPTKGTLEMTSSPSGAVAVGYNLQSQQECYFRVNGNIISADTQDDYSTESMIPAKLALATAPKEFSPRTVFAPNNRTRVQSTSILPYSAVVFIRVAHQMPTGVLKYTSGSGCLISANTVFTAAHVIHDDDYGWPVSIEVVPGINHSSFSNKPYGSAMAEEVAMSVQYYDSLSSLHDWGLIRLEDPIGYECGYTGIKFVTRNMENVNITMIGYPGDLNNGTYYQYEETNAILHDQTEDATPSTYRVLLHCLDGFDGQSGGPMLYTNKCIGVYTGGLVEYPYNISLGITSQLFSFILAYG